MYSRRCLLLTPLFLLACASAAFPQSEPNAANFTLQVASFPNTELANNFVVQLVKTGEHPTCATVELQGRGYWTRVFLGLFATPDAARRYGENLMARGIVDEYLVRRADLNQAALRPRRVSLTTTSTNESATTDGSVSTISSADVASKLQAMTTVVEGKDSRVGCLDPVDGFDLPVRRATPIAFASTSDTASIPRPDPVALAFKLIVDYLNVDRDKSHARGGLWVTGDIAEGLSRLQWIAGEENACLINLKEDGRVELNKRLLARAASVGTPRVEDPLKVASYIASNEGLLLLVQMVEGDYRYVLHIGNQAPTRGRTIDVAGSINLDNNYDSRINRYRKDGRKLNEERPPEGFAAIIGMNPVAQWFNLSTHSWVPVGEITLHELAEAHAKVALGLDYLQQGSSPGAHDVALERERRLKAQRPDADIVLTAGSNRVLRSQEEIRLFYAEAASDFGKQ